MMPDEWDVEKEAAAGLRALGLLILGPAVFTLLAVVTVAVLRS